MSLLSSPVLRGLRGTISGVGEATFDLDARNSQDEQRLSSRRTCHRILDTAPYQGFSDSALASGRKYFFAEGNSTSLGKLFNEDLRISRTCGAVGESVD